ncbi:MAG: heat-inducible transcription repressor HrcA [Anaerolineaceae bacterium]|nr:heat-inducible transcription repressor HrcA [Anaerolineaceae bacterium]
MVELTERQKVILSLVVHEYVRTASPVGSKNLVKQYHLEYSSATVRNEMAALTEAQYLSQPYTSAGRVPTEQGYRFFVSGLIQMRELPNETRRMIEHQFSQAQQGMDGWIKLAASILADQANAISMVSAPLPNRTKVKYISLISITNKQILMILVLAGGQMQQRFLFVNEVMTQSRLNEIADKLNNLFEGLDSEEIRALSKKLPETGDTVDEIVRTLLNTLYDTDARQTGEVYTEGINKVLAEPEFSDSEEARRTLRFLEEKPLLQNFLSRTTREQKVGGVQVFFGGEGLLKDIANCSLVVARYGMQGIATGTIGVLGPMRMAYSKNIPTVRFLAGILSDLVVDSGL